MFSSPFIPLALFASDAPLSPAIAALMERLESRVYLSAVSGASYLAANETPPPFSVTLTPAIEVPADVESINTLSTSSPAAAGTVSSPPVSAPEIPVASGSSSSINSSILNTGDANILDAAISTIGNGLTDTFNLPAPIALPPLR